MRLAASVIPTELDAAPKRYPRGTRRAVCAERRSMIAAPCRTGPDSRARRTSPYPSLPDALHPQSHLVLHRETTAVMRRPSGALKTWILEASNISPETKKALHLCKALISLVFLAPRPGLEPGTYGLTDDDNGRKTGQRHGQLPTNQQLSRRRPTLSDANRPLPTVFLLTFLLTKTR